MDVLAAVLTLAAVAMLALGGYLAVSVPRVIREAGGSAIVVRALGTLLLCGGSGALLGLGGAILAALVGAAAVAVWLDTVFLAGTGVAALSALGFTIYAVWRAVAGAGNWRTRGR
jgi:hypothetical protein